MGIETIIIAASIALSVASAVAGAVMTPKSKQKMKRDINNLQVTQAEEGQCVPIVYGTTRISGSIIWYGNMDLKAISPPGGKGGGGGGGADSFKVYADVHIVLCEGKITLDEIYKDEEVYSPDASITFNDGENGLYENYGEYATKLNGIAHIYLKHWYLGDNNYTVPSLSFKVTRVLPTSCPLENSLLLTTGENPAIIIWDLLRRTPAELDLSSFEDVNTIYNNRNIGLNLAFGEQQEISKMIEKVFSHVDVILFSINNVFFLKDLTQSEAVVSEITTNDIKDATFTRPAYNQILNDFAANYTDANNTQRTVRLVNEANYRITGEYRSHSLDLNGFNNLQVVSDRLADIVRRESFPNSEISFITNLKFYYMFPGDLFSLEFEPWGLSKKFRVQEIEKNTFENTIKITAREWIVDNLQGVAYDVGTPLWQEIDFSAVDLDYVKILDFRYGEKRDWTGKFPVAILPAKKTMKELSYLVYYSLDGISYSYLQTCYGYFYHGTLIDDYLETFDIDDSEGILISFDEANFALNSITRTELFTTKRIVVVGNEMMKFQTVETVGSNFLLKGVLRDKQESHTAGEDVFIGEIVDNVIYFPLATKYYIKILPKTFRKTLDVADATEIIFEPNLKIDGPSDLKATRSGSDVILNINQNLNAASGCGYASADVITDPIPPVFGNFYISIDSGAFFPISSSQYTLSQAGAIEISVKQYLNGLESQPMTINIGPDDGEYTND